MYQFKCQVAEIHGEYRVQSVLLWQQPDGEEYVAGDTFKVSAGSVDGDSEHGDIMLLLQAGLSRIARKYDRTLF